MREFELEYNEMKEEILALLKNASHMTVATCENQRVTARIVTCINREFNIQFQTYIESRKYQQIKANPHVALCFENMQIEGIAAIKGHPQAEENIQHLIAFKSKYPKIVEKWSSLSNMVVIEVSPTLISLYRSPQTADVPRDCLDFLDLQDNKAYRKYIYPDERKEPDL